MYQRVTHVFLGILTLFFLVPEALFAAGAIDKARDFVDAINRVIFFPLIALMMAIALLVFLYGAFKFVLGAANETERDTGKRHMLWGIIGLLVMLSAMTILTIAAGTFGLDRELEEAQSGAGSTYNEASYSTGFQGVISI